MALVTLVYANIAISWQLLRFNSLKKHFPQIYRFKRFENSLEKKFPDLKFFPDFGWKTRFFPDFPDWKKSSKFSLNSLLITLSRSKRIEHEGTKHPLKILLFCNQWINKPLQPTHQTSSQYEVARLLSSIFVVFFPPWQHAMPSAYPWQKIRL